MLARYGLRTFALGYLGLLLFIPVAMIFYRVFQEGIGNAWASITSPEGVHAFWLTIEVVAIAVPLNTIFGVVCALVLVRRVTRTVHVHGPITVVCSDWYRLNFGIAT